MDSTLHSNHLLPCAMPRCSAVTTLAEAIYVDGCGPVCLGCAGPLPGWLGEIDLPW